MRASKRCPRHPNKECQSQDSAGVAFTCMKSQDSHIFVNGVSSQTGNSAKEYRRQCNEKVGNPGFNPSQGSGIALSKT